jgi:ribosomal protein L16 Arg81 hydroxylase
MTSRFDPASGLSGLLAPLNAADFFAQHWEQKPLHAHAKRDFTGLISTARMDALLADQVFDADSLSMARAEPRVGPEAYLGENGLVDRGLAARAYQEGATLIMPQLHRRERALAQLCRALEAEFSHAVQTNIYLTPPNAQGFQTHYDTHDVLVLQVEGTKRWRLYDTPVGAPFRGEQFTPDAVAAGHITAELVMEPGDVLYVPRGLMHDAVNADTDGPSLHITTGILVRTWADFLLEAVSEVALKSPALRAALPPGFAAMDADALKPQFEAALQAVNDDADVEAVLTLFADRFTTTRQADTAGAIMLGQPSERLRIRRRALIPLHLAEDGDHIALVAPGGPVSFDTPAEDALKRLIAGETLSAEDFAAMGEDKSHDAIARLIAFGAAEAV